jgi:hypothetical protein
MIVREVLDQMLKDQAEAEEELAVVQKKFDDAIKQQREDERFIAENEPLLAAPEGSMMDRLVQLRGETLRFIFRTWHC